MSISFHVPGRGSYHIESIVFDLNGTLTVDGKLRESTRKLLYELSGAAVLYVLTADTQNSALRIREELGKSVNLKVLAGEDTTTAKRNFVNELGSHQTAAVGNGANDTGMLEEAVLSVALLEKEGCASEILLKCHILVRCIDDALELFLNTKRLVATLRR